MTTIPQNVLTGRGLIKRYGRVTALDNADFDLRAGEILAVIGDNGAGKSTLIKAMSGAITVDDGEIQLDGRPIRFRSPMEARDAGIETVYQTLALSPALSIADNMFLGREIRKSGVFGRWFRSTDRKAMESRARAMLSELGLATIQNISQAVETLSGGQRQGVAVARAAAFSSKVVIMDEPTAALGVVLISARIVHHGRYVDFQLADIAVPRALFAEIVRRIDRLGRDLSSHDRRARYADRHRRGVPGERGSVDGFGRRLLRPGHESDRIGHGVGLRIDDAEPPAEPVDVDPVRDLEDVKESRRVLELILDVKRRGLPIVLISHNMPHSHQHSAACAVGFRLRGHDQPVEASP